MSTPLRAAVTGGLLAFGSAAAADVPAVAADIAPVHGLVARVMEGVGTPELIVRPGASPHGYALRPSEARALEQSDAVFWIGSALTPWLGRTLDTLAADAETVTLLEAEETRTLSYREGATFGEHAHDHGHDDHDGDADAGEDDHDAAHGDLDPHAWLDPENAKAWLGLIADTLATLDPENAETYRDNAAAGRQEVDAAAAEVRETLDRIGPLTFVVFHDAYHYFEARFDFEAAGAIALSDATDPSPARVEEVRETVATLGVECVFAEPQFNQTLAGVVLEGTDGRPGTIDPLGIDIPTGPDFYPALLRSIADEIAACRS